MVTRLLIANRGEIALRVNRTAQAMGLETVAVYSDADAAAAHVRAADRAVRIGPGPAAESYLRGERILEAAAATGAEAIHPGYGFLSENAAFAEAARAAGLVFVGPRPETISAMGLKDAARRIAAEAGAPVIPGYDGADQDPARLAAEAEAIGFPVMIKARAGGGGKGMRAVARAEDFAEGLASARREAAASFGDDAVLIEKQILSPRHLEVQLFGDAHGGLVHLFERDCSLQRRHQKVIEEAPGPGVSPEMRAALTEAALAIGRAVAYENAGTVEFIADASEGLRPDRFYFLEMNTRLQVEHPVTEMVTGLDLVEWQLRVAAREPLPLAQEAIRLSGAAVEARLYAEDPSRDFAPAAGRLTALALPDARLRIDAGVTEGDVVTPYYDPMIAKAIAWAPTRETAHERLARGLDGALVGGVATNLAFLRRLLRDPAVRAGAVETGFIAAALDALTAEGAPAPLATALAAIAALGLAPLGGGAAAERSADPWTRLLGYRAWGRPTQSVDLVSGAAGDASRLALSVTPLGAGAGAARRFEVALGEAAALTLALEPRGEGRLAVESEGLRSEASLLTETSAAGLRLTVALGAETARFLAPDPLAAPLLASGRGAGSAAQRGGAGDDAARAPMPGLLKAVLVQPGDAVAAGQPVAEMEAMKMALTLKAPGDGVVEAVLAAPGDQLEDGAVVVRFAPAPEEET